MSKYEIAKRKEKIEHIQQQYSSFAASVSIPDNVQMMVFDIPYRKIEAQDLCGIVFPEKDYIKLEERIKMFNLNAVKKPEQYVGVYWDFKHPLAVLEMGLQNIEKSPIKIIYDNGQYIFSKKPMLSKAQEMLLLDAGFEVLDVTDDLVEVLKNAKKLVEYKLNSEQSKNQQ